MPTVVAWCAILAVLAHGAAAASNTADRLVVHEWGTFTSFQDTTGVTVHGVNVDDEPVPAFVHRLPAGRIVRTLESLPTTWSQGALRCDTAVTLRLETPVVISIRHAASATRAVSTSTPPCAVAG